MNAAATLNDTRLTAPDISTIGSFTARNNSLISANAFSIAAAQAVIETGTDVVIGSNLHVGYQSGGASTLSIRNAGSTFSIAGNLRVGGAGEGTLLISDAATGTISGMLTVGEETTSLNKGFVSLGSSAAVTLQDDLRIASVFGGGSPPTGTVTIADGGMMTLQGTGAELHIGSAATSAGTLLVNAGGRFEMHPAAAVALNATGTIVVDGGEARLGTFVGDPAGTIIFNSGTLGTHGVLNVSIDGAVGPALDIGPDRALHHGGTFTINGGTAALTGGTLSVGTIGFSTSNLDFRTGKLSVTGSAGLQLDTGQALGSFVALGDKQWLDVTNRLELLPNTQVILSGGTLTTGNMSIAPSGIADLIHTSGRLTTGTLSVGVGGRILIGPTATLISDAGGESFGQIELAGGFARLAGAGTLINHGLIAGDGEISKGLATSTLSELRVNAGQTLRVNLLPANSGRISVNDGQIDLLFGLFNNSGTINLSDGVLNAAAGMTNSGRITGRGTLRSTLLTNSGTITFSGGFSDLDAPVFNNAGRTIVTGGGLTTFFGAVTNIAGGELRVSTGATAVFLGDVTGAGFITGGGQKIFEAGASGLLATPGDSVVEAGGNLALDHIRERSLTINGGNVNIVANGTPTGVSRLSELLIAGNPGNWNGQFDLSDNALVIDYPSSSPRLTVVDYLKTGFSAGAWNGQGIHSSAAGTQLNRALGVAEASDIGSPLNFLGQGVDNTSLLIRFTIPGDANLDAVVNISDFSLLATNFNTASYWARGDFNFNGATEIGDFALLASNFNVTLPLPLPRAAVPEPNAVAAGIAAVTISARRIRRRG